MSDAETARLIHQSLLGDAWENARQAVVVFDDARNFVAFNSAYCELTGYDREEILELRVGGRLVADAASREAFEQALAIGGGAVGRARMTRKDGSVIDVGYRLVETNVSALPFTIALVWREI
jgi:PAS domain S-box-containing protein